MGSIVYHPCQSPGQPDNKKGVNSVNPKDYKEVYLEHRDHHPQAITLEAYEQIIAIIKANLICTYCCKGYTDQRPQIAENVCLACFFTHRDQPPSDLTFLGEVPSEYADRYGYKIYKFKDRKGFLYTIDSHSKINEPLDQSISATLRHYGYTVPEHYTLKTGKTVDLAANCWRSIYGDFQTSPVVIATYKEYYGDHIDNVSLLYRDGTNDEYTRRKKQLRTWYEETKAEIEATYKPHQGYIVGTDADGRPHTTYQLGEHHMYEGIVARAVAECHQTHKEDLS